MAELSLASLGDTPQNKKLSLSDLFALIAARKMDYGGALRSLGESLMTLPRRAMDEATSLQYGGSYNAGPALEAAMLPMGGTFAGAPAGALGAGPVRQLTPTSRAVTVRNAQRITAPGIYDNPRAIVEEAAARMAAEDPALKQLWGVTREDMYDLSKGRVGNIQPSQIAGIPQRAFQGSEAVTNVMTPRNAQRMIDVLQEGERFPRLIHGADAWYYSDPKFQRLLELTGGDMKKSIELFNRQNTFSGMASPLSDVLTEINRGSHANYLSSLGRMEDFIRYGGKPGQRGAPPDMANIMGHMAHSTAQAPTMARFAETGTMPEMTTGKVPAYIPASGVPETGFQTAYPVMDAHMGKSTGLADTRGVSGGSFKLAQTHPLAQWFARDVAAPVGLEAVPAQARAWTLFGPQTGVRSELGAPKLELESQQIMKAAKRAGMNPEKVRDLWLQGKMPIGALAASPTIEPILRALSEGQGDTQ